LLWQSIAFFNSTHKRSSSHIVQCSFLLLRLLLEEIEFLGGEDGDGSGAGHDLGADVLSKAGSEALVAVTLFTLASLGGTHANSA